MKQSVRAPSNKARRSCDITTSNRITELTTPTSHCKAPFVMRLFPIGFSQNLVPNAQSGTELFFKKNILREQCVPSRGFSLATKFHPWPAPLNEPPEPETCPAQFQTEMPALASPTKAVPQPSRNPPLGTPARQLKRE